MEKPLGKDQLKRARDSLSKIDRETFEARLKNLTELMPFFAIDVHLEVALPSGTQNFWNEALVDYLNECFRSCIFSCASAVEQTFKERLISDSEDPEASLWRFQIKKSTFGEIIKEARQNKNLKEYISKANKINKIRNEIAVHPIQIPTFPKPQTRRKSVLTNLTMIRAVRKLLTFLPNKLSDEITNLNVGKDKKRTLREILDDPTVPEIRLAWHDLQRVLLRYFAHTTLIDTHSIMAKLYGKKK